MFDHASEQQHAQVDLSGKHVQVDLSGLVADGVVIGQGLTSRGRVSDAGETDGMITVHLDMPIAGKELLHLPTERVVPIP